MIRRVAVGALGVVLVALLAACNLTSRVVVRPDGSGTYSVNLTVPNGKTNAGASLYKAVHTATSHSNVPLQVAPYTAGDEGGAQLTFAFRSLADLEAESARLAKLGGGLGGITVSRDQSGWHFATNLAQSLVAPPGQGANGPTGGVINPSAFSSLIHLSVIVELPGAPAENNATAVTHSATTSTFNWVMTVGKPAPPLQAGTTFVGDQVSVRLASALTPVSGGSSSSGSGGVSGLAIAGLGAGAVVLVSAGTFGIRRRRRRVAD
jgi:hypothetical protein